MNNLSLKILSVIAAVLLWLVVVNVDDPIKTETYSGIRVTMVNESAITNKGKVYKIEDESDVISVTVSAKRSVHKALSSSDFIATADMEKDIQYDNLVAINVTCTNKNVKAADIKKSRNNVKVSIEDSATEEFNVVVKQRGTPGSGYVVGEMIPEQRVISVTGPASLIAKIKRIEAEVDVTGRTADDVLTCSLSVVNSDGDALDTTYLEFNGKSIGISVKVNMLRTKEVPLKIGVSGTPASGYRYIDMSFKPETVMIAGEAEDLQEIAVLRVPDEAVNIEGLRSTTELEISLTEYLPENIRLVDEVADGLVVVTVTLEGEQTKDVTIPISNVSLTGVPKGYSVTFGDLEEVTIPVTGLAVDLESLDPDDIAATLDVSSVTKEGIYTKPLQIHIPGDYGVNADVEVEFELLKGDSGKGNTETEEDKNSDSDTSVNGSGSTTDGETSGTGSGSSGNNNSENSGNSGSSGDSGTENSGTSGSTSGGTDQEGSDDGLDGSGTGSDTDGGTADTDKNTSGN